MRIKKFAEISGNTVGAIEAKIKRGDWVEGLEYRRAPDGNLYVNLEGFERWVEGRRGA